MKNISSMNPNITSGLHLALFRTSSSKLAMNMLTKLGAYFFAHGGTRSLEKPLIVKQEIIAQFKQPVNLFKWYANVIFIIRFPEYL